MVILLEERPNGTDERPSNPLDAQTPNPSDEERAVIPEHNLASLSQRFFANFIDSIGTSLSWFAFLMMAFHMFLLQNTVGVNIRSILDRNSTWVIFFIIIIFNIFYIVACLVLLVDNGQTVGKKLLGIKVVKLDGSKPSLFRFILMRWALINVLPAFLIMNFAWLVLLIDACAIFFSDRRRTLHDYIADTLVVKARGESAWNDAQNASSAKTSDIDALSKSNAKFITVLFCAYVTVVTLIRWGVFGRKALFWQAAVYGFAKGRPAFSIEMTFGGYILAALPVIIALYIVITRASERSAFLAAVFALATILNHVIDLAYSLYRLIPLPGRFGWSTTIISHVIAQILSVAALMFIMSLVIVKVRHLARLRGQNSVLEILRRDKIAVLGCAVICLIFVTAPFFTLTPHKVMLFLFNLQ
jgi:uncharacterized RDD family membrane protein YckC